MLTISGAIFFGWFWGAVFSILSAGIGACVVFIITASIQSSFFKNKIVINEGMYYKFKQEVQKNAFFYLLSLRFMPAFPFIFINIASAIVGIKFSIYAITTFLGIIPGAIVYSLLGAGITKTILQGKIVKNENLYSYEAIIGLIGLSVMMLLPIIYKKYIKRKPY